MLLTRNLFKLNPKKLRHFSTVSDHLTKWTDKFKSENVSEPESSAKHLLAHILQTRNLDTFEQKLDTKLTEVQVKHFEELCLARLCRMPVQYIIKEWDFHGLQGIKIVPPVFIPRPETEELVSHVIEDLQKNDMKNVKFLEIGCGSGVISISLLSEFSGATGWCFDQNQIAVELTKVNAENFNVLSRLNVFKYKLVDGNLESEMKSQKFDLIVSNPPYLLSKEIFELEDDIKVFEDLRALDGGRDGLVVINNILKVAEIHLNKNGVLWLEVHPTHSTILKERFPHGASNSLVFEESLKDFCGKNRFIKFIKIT
uniref:peptide chain release factor N(5)-glutamine methyltransferase n=1 Tax=Culicoides sonorensis TaxID=179676 RepID=A0A336MN26_CULSO